jgi:hypothetical protein
MELARNGSSHLIVNKRVNIFGTMYNPDEDLVSIPLGASSAIQRGGAAHRRRGRRQVPHRVG